MPQGRVPDRQKSVVCSLLRVLQRHSKNLSFGPPREGAPTLPERLETTFNTPSLNILYLHISNLSLLLRHEKGLQHGIEKGHRGGPGETHPKTQAAPSGYGARRGSREGPQAA